ncbi:hypothetical protein OIU79_009966 [Salix purpurea]|uniref:Uncharacterized protein n=1 Tax=Salix purpurea TaxID=77065 RepID=A0A9Q0QFK6_SALPP|nr:hypothetical protein OIU79_009966 [Salix purpurea]
MTSTPQLAQHHEVPLPTLSAPKATEAESHEPPSSSTVTEESQLHPPPFSNEETESLFLSIARVTLCRDRPLYYTAPSGLEALSYYRLTATLHGTADNSRPSKPKCRWSLFLTTFGSLNPIWKFFYEI